MSTEQDEPFDDLLESSGANSNVAELSVSDISNQLKRMVEDAFGRVRVRGEIAGYRGPHSSGHMYFALKDDKARIEAVIWRGVAGKLKHRPEEGMEVIATGKLTTYPGSSKYQIVIENIEPAGAGALMALLEARKRKLDAEGLFAAERKQLLPYLPLVVGVVTSPTGSVIRDILHRIMDRFPLKVIIWPVRVQGETSGQEVANAINGFNDLPETGAVSRPDVLIVARGGGSIEDLWGFNEEAVVRAAANSLIPLVSAVGHETDWTLIDLAADVRAPTPTGAAEMVVPVKADLVAHLATLASRLRSGLNRNLEAAKTDLRAAIRGLPSPDSLFAVHNQRFDKASSALAQGLVAAIQIKRLDFQKQAARLNPQLLSGRNQQHRQRLGYVQSRLALACESQITLKRNRLDKARLTHNMLEPALRNAEQRLGFQTKSLTRSFEEAMMKLSSRLDQASRLLISFNHDKTLERGFVLVRDGSGNVITRVQQTENHHAYELQFADGRLDVIANNHAAGPSSKSAKSAKAAEPSKQKQGDLF